MRLFHYDPLHYRIDIPRLTGRIVLVLMVFAWALVPATGVMDAVLRLLAGGAFAAAVRLLLGRMGTSRFSGTLLTLAAFACIGMMSAAQAAELALWLSMALAAQEYFIRRTKLTAVAVAIYGGVAAAGAGKMGVSMLILFCGLLLCRLVWHAVIERISKKAWVLFSIKAVAASVVAGGIFWLLHGRFDFPWNDSQPLAWPDAPVVMLAIAILLALRGLWAVFLLKTKRSPIERGLRLFWLVMAAAAACLVAFSRAFAHDIFQAPIVVHLESAGWLSYSPEIMVFAIVTALLYVGAGIDRSLYRDARLARWLKVPTK